MKKTKITKQKTKCFLKVIRLISLGRGGWVGGRGTKFVQRRISANQDSLQAPESATEETGPQPGVWKWDLTWPHFSFSTN